MSRLSLNNLIEYIEKNETFLKKDELIEKVEEEYKFESAKLNKRERLLTFNLENLDSIFGDYLEDNKIYRQGMIRSIKNPKNKNISLISSLLFCLYENFELNSEKILSVFVRKFISDSSKAFIDNEYAKLGWIKKEFLEDIRQTNITKMYMRYLVDYLKINMFLLDIELDTLYYVGEKNLIPFKKNIFIIKLEDDVSGEIIYEPIFTKTSREHILMRKLMNSKFLIEYVDCNFTIDEEDLNFTIEREDLDKYLSDSNNDNVDNNDNISDISTSEKSESDKFDEEIYSDYEDDELDKKKNFRLRDGITDKPTFTEDHESIDSENIDTKFLVDDMTIITEQKELETKIKVNKSMKVAELKKIAKDLGIKLSYTDDNKKKNKTKNMLIDEINNF